jgi:hypothetical protein
MNNEKDLAEAVRLLRALVTRLASAACAGIEKDGGWPELIQSNAFLAAHDAKVKP